MQNVMVLLAPWRGNGMLNLCKIITSKFRDKTNTIQFSIDVLNIGNLLNSDWD
jgi:hypothetical protein